MVVYLIGAGPGDADLITLKAVKALNKADVVLYDYLANEEILAHAPEDAEKIYVGKKAGQHYKTQDQINELIVQQANVFFCCLICKCIEISQCSMDILISA
jgi:uroporphyrin-III C-methyltransferase